MCDPVPAAPATAMSTLISNRREIALAHACHAGKPACLPNISYTPVPVDPKSYMFWFDGKQYTAVPAEAPKAAYAGEAIGPSKPWKEGEMAGELKAATTTRSASDEFLIKRQQETIEGQQKALFAKDQEIAGLKCNVKGLEFDLSCAQKRLEMEISFSSGLTAGIENLAQTYANPR